MEWYRITLPLLCFLYVRYKSVVLIVVYFSFTLSLIRCYKRPSCSWNSDFHCSYLSFEEARNSYQCIISQLHDSIAINAFHLVFPFPSLPPFCPVLGFAFIICCFWKWSSQSVLRSLWHLPLVLPLFLSCLLIHRCDQELVG